MLDQTEIVNATAPPTEPESLIDEKLNFHKDGKAVAATASEEAGSSYNVISTIGSQGSGCSTLLNDLFTTSFSTMGAEFQRTTFGVSHAWSPEYKALLLNIQGLAGGEPAVIEKKLTQFSAAASTIMLVNVKQDEVTRHAVQHKAVLETLIQTILERYEQDDSLRQPVTLVYVIRDWDGSMTSESAEVHVMRGLLEIWERVTREMGAAEAQFNDHVHVSVATLPHKVYDAEGYNAQIETLRDRLRIDATEGVQPTKIRNDVPVEAIFGHLGSIWKTVRGRVNITEERKDLSERLCPLLINSALQVSKKAIKEKVDVDAAAVDFKKGCEDSRLVGLAHYDHLATAYDPSVVAKHRNILVSSINAELFITYMIHVKGLSSIALSEYSRRLIALQKTVFPMPPMAPKVLLSRMDDLKSDCIKVFKDLARTARLNEEWTFESEVEELGRNIDLAGETVRRQQQAIEASMEKSSIPSLGTMVSALWRS